MEIELQSLVEEPSLVQDTQIFTIRRKGFWTYEYRPNYPPVLMNRISEEHYRAILGTISRIQDRFPITPVIIQAMVLLVLLLVFEVVLMSAVFTLFVLAIGFIITILTPIIFGIIRILNARDQQIAGVTAFLGDANTEFREVGLCWYYSSPEKPLTLIAEGCSILRETIPEHYKTQMIEDFGWEQYQYHLDAETLQKMTGQVRCTCVFLKFNELLESGALISTTIPQPSLRNALCRISLFPSGRIKMTIMVALMDVASAWLNISDIFKLILTPSPIFSIWEATHIFSAPKLVDLLALHIDD